MVLPGIKQFELHDRVVIVTGGSKGLGQAMAAGLASAGANLVLVSRNQAEVEAAAAEISRDYDVQVIGLQADVTLEDQVQGVVDTCLEKFGKVDVLINNAGINIRGPIEERSEEHTSELQSRTNLVCRLLLEKKKIYIYIYKLAALHSAEDGKHIRIEDIDDA